MSHDEQQEEEMRLEGVLLELRECLLAWESGARVLGNVAAGDALRVIDMLMMAAARYSVFREQGVISPIAIAGVWIGQDPELRRGFELDAYADRQRRHRKGACPRNFWCVHEVLCPGARR